MRSTFEYSAVITKSEDISIASIGNCAIEAISEDFMYYYLIVITINGNTETLYYGPIIPDSSMLAKSVACEFHRMTYSDAKVRKLISGFLNPKGINIIQAKELSFEEALEILNKNVSIVENYKTILQNKIDNMTKDDTSDDEEEEYF